MAIVRLEHARHNQKACEFLDDHKAYPDWVVTMAFYSANHYARYSIFPIKIDGQDYDDLDPCFFVHGNGMNKHTFLVKLVDDKIPQIADAFRLLLNDCNSARYYNYDVSEIVAKRALSSLRHIQKHCEMNKGKRTRK